jgi:hypothetical protein
MSAYYLSKRREEEEAQRRAVHAQVAAKNAALRAKEAQMREQAKIQNYLQGKAMLEAALTNADQAAWLEQADMSESERHAAYVKSDSYKAYQANMAAWQKQQEQIAWLENADKTEAERLADYKATPAYIKRAETLAAWQAEQERKKQSDAWAAFRDVEKGSYTASTCGPEDVQQEKAWTPGVFMGSAAIYGDTLDAASQVAHVNFTPLNNGMVSVNANGLPAGLRRNYLTYLDDFDLPAGGNYLPGTVAGRTTAGLLGRAAALGSVGLTFATSGVSNLIQFGLDPTQGETFWDRTFLNKKFYVSTVVDTVLGVVIGLAAAAAVGLALVLGAPLTLTGAVIVTGAIAIGIGFGVEFAGIPEWLKTPFYDLLDE